MKEDELTFVRRRAAEELVRAYLQQILVIGVFHADPHPGNVFLTDDHRIALLDLGMVARVGPSMQEQLLKLSVIDYFTNELEWHIPEDGEVESNKSSQ